MRDELAKTINPEKGGMRARVYAYFLKETVPFKCSLRMRLMRVAGDVSLPITLVFVLFFPRFFYF